jgi:hypothetical protein
MDSLKKVLMNRDGLTEEQADKQIEECRKDLMARLADGDMPYDICGEYFGLEPDYLEDLIF